MTLVASGLFDLVVPIDIDYGEKFEFRASSYYFERLRWFKKIILQRELE